MKTFVLKNIFLRAVAILASAVVLASCGASSKSVVSSSSSNDFVNGSTAATLLSHLAASYQNSGNSLDLTNVSNILDVSSLASCLSSLKGDVSQTVIDFKAGLSSGLKDKLSKDEIQKVGEALMDISSLDLATIGTDIQRGRTSSIGVQEIKTGLERILSLF